MLSPKWFELFDGGLTTAKHFVESSLQVLRLDVGRYRSELIKLDTWARSLVMNPDQTALSQLLERLQQLNTDWMKNQSEAAAVLAAGRDGLGDFAMLGANLEDVLLEQAAQIETTCSNLDLLDFANDMESGGKRLTGELRKLADLSHSLRDRINESLLGVVRAEQQVDLLDEALQYDSTTGIRNTCGMEVIFDKFWRDDPGRTRIVSCGMIDLDRLGRHMDAHGSAACDRLIVAISTEISNLIRKDRGYDVAARVEGQRFFTFLGDTGARNATSAMERMRQGIEAVSFEIDGKTIELSVTCAATDVRRDDTPEMIFERLDATIKAARRSGRNRTFLDDGTGPLPIEAPSYNVRSKVVVVE